LQSFENSKEINQKNQWKYLEEVGKIFKKVAKDLNEQELITEEVLTEDDAES
jgi:uncharacterized membrane-anchored protein